MSAIYNKNASSTPTQPTIRNTTIKTPLIESNRSYNEYNNGNVQLIKNQVDTILEFSNITTTEVVGLEPTNNNSIFKNTTKDRMILLVTCSASTLCEEKSNITCFSLWLSKTSNTKSYLQSSIPSSSPELNILATCTSGVIELLPDESFSFIIYISGSDTSYETGINTSNLINMLTIYRLA